MTREEEGGSGSERRGTERTVGAAGEGTSEVGKCRSGQVGTTARSPSPPSACGWRWVTPDSSLPSSSRALPLVGTSHSQAGPTRCEASKDGYFLTFHQGAGPTAGGCGGPYAWSPLVPAPQCPPAHPISSARSLSIPAAWSLCPVPVHLRCPVPPHPSPVPGPHLPYCLVPGPGPHLSPLRSHPQPCCLLPTRPSCPIYRVPVHPCHLVPGPSLCPTSLPGPHLSILSPVPSPCPSLLPPPPIPSAWSPSIPAAWSLVPVTLVPATWSLPVGPPARSGSVRLSSTVSRERKTLACHGRRRGNRLESGAGRKQRLKDESCCLT